MSLAAKEWTSMEGHSVWEMECHMDVEMFLDGCAGWEVVNPHWPIILHGMFQHAVEQGQKELECMICWGHWHGLPKLDPQVEVSAIQLVWPQTNEEDIRALYYVAYQLRRLPGSLHWGLGQMKEMTTEIMSSLEDHLKQKEGKSLQRIEEPGLADIWPPRSKTPRRGGGTLLLRGTSLRWGKPTGGPWTLQPPWRKK